MISPALQLEEFFSDNYFYYQVKLGRGGGRACSTLHPPAAHAKIIQKNRTPLKDKCVILLWRRRLRIADGIKTKGGIYMRPGPTQTAISSYRSPYISFHAFTWDRPKNKFRPVVENSYPAVAYLTRHEILSGRTGDRTVLM